MIFTFEKYLIYLERKGQHMLCTALQIQAQLEVKNRMSTIRIQMNFLMARQ